MKELAYLLVTYAIEVRAESLYLLYHEILQKAASKVYVKSIILEEKEHLNEMRRQLSECQYMQIILDYEHTLYKKWLTLISDSILY